MRLYSVCMLSPTKEALKNLVILDPEYNSNHTHTISWVKTPLLFGTNNEMDDLILKILNKLKNYYIFYHKIFKSSHLNLISYKILFEHKKEKEGAPKCHLTNEKLRT